MNILASNSPRRKELLKGLDIEYRTWVIPDIEESYPDTLQAEEIEELKEAEEIEKVKETQEVKEIEELKETEINNKKEIIICCGIQVNCNDKKHNMLERVEKYIDQAKDELNNMGKDMDLLVLPEQFVQLPETAEY